MKSLMSIAVLLALGSSALAQVSGGALERQVIPASAMDGALLVTMATPQGEATVLVFESGLALLKLPTMGLSWFGFVENVPTPQMHEVEVGIGYCQFVVVTGGAGFSMSIPMQVPNGKGSTFAEAFQDLQNNMKLAGGTGPGSGLFPCGTAGG